MMKIDLVTNIPHFVCFDQIISSTTTMLLWCMSGSLTRIGGENVPGIPGACATRNFA